MKLFRFGPVGGEKPGVRTDDGALFDVSAFGEDYGEAFFGSDGPGRLRAWFASNGKGCPRVGGGERTASAVTRPSKLVCVGLNFRSHAAETGAQIPTEPVLFMKASSALAGPNDELTLPRGSRATDWEVEFALVIGKRARYVSKADAPKHIAGYVLHNDYSERDHQKERGGQWVKGKSADGFAPLGPWLVLPDAVNPFDTELWLSVNGEEMQRSSTSDLIFDVPTLVSYISEFMTLLPGDVISTGTPAGVGMGKTPPRYLRPGDVVEYGATGLGSAKHQVIAAELA
jgi:2-keto-4-pentenoate hydratase/2-oxohepta-3-ene-1,7-dioic acid hydratase in catechol pathway